METKVNVITLGRFHLCNLARELSHNGFDVKFYSFMSPKRAARYGVPKSCCVSFFFVMLPFVVLERKIVPGKKWAALLCHRVEDFFVRHFMRKCDVSIILSSVFGHSIEAAKKRGDIVIVEQGSKHVREQKRILESMPSYSGKIVHDAAAIERSEHDFRLADYIAVASDHVVRSMVMHGVPKKKLFVNPYGVDLSNFYPAPADIEPKYDVIMVGSWGYRKGCDLIVEALRGSGLKFLHVGVIGDMPFPVDAGFTHVDAVDQSRLINYYHQAKVAVLPSREEGLAMVQAQAVACNLPLVGSPDSGAEDLQEMGGEKQYIRIISDYTPAAVKKEIDTALSLWADMGSTIYAGTAIENMTWQAYGKRYAEFLRKITK